MAFFGISNSYQCQPFSKQSLAIGISFILTVIHWQVSPFGAKGKTLRRIEYSGAAGRFNFISDATPVAHTSVRLPSSHDSSSPQPALSARRACELPKSIVISALGVPAESLNANLCLKIFSSVA